MKTATFIRDVSLDNRARGEMHLFRCEPPMTDYDGNEYEYVITSAVINTFCYETFIFPATKEGKVVICSELPGSTPEIFDHNQVLVNAGYSPIKEVKDAEPTKLLK